MLNDASIRELYQSMIIDHGRSPRNFKVLENATCQQIAHNPLCGDELTLYLHIEHDQITHISFQGSGCAISMASASLMSETLKGKTTQEAQQLFEAFHQAVLDKADAATELPHKLNVLVGVKSYPSRVKCATLAWHALVGAINNDHHTTTISTE